MRQKQEEKAEVVMMVKPLALKYDYIHNILFGRRTRSSPGRCPVCKEKPVKSLY